jgi:hypothetical protein
VAASGQSQEEISVHVKKVTKVLPTNTKGAAQNDSSNEIWEKLQSQINDLTNSNKQMQETQQSTDTKLVKLQQATMKDLNGMGEFIEKKYETVVEKLTQLQVTSETRLLEKMATTEARMATTDAKTASSLDAIMLLLQGQNKKSDEAEAKLAVKENEYRKYKEAQETARREDKENLSVRQLHTDEILGRAMQLPGMDVRPSTTKKKAANDQHQVDNSKRSPHKKSKTGDEFFADDSWHISSGMDYSTEGENKENDRAKQKEPVVGPL